MKKIFILLFMILSLNTFAQKVEFYEFKDSYATYVVLPTTWGLGNTKAVSIYQIEEGNYLENYWHSSLKVKLEELIEFLKETKDLSIERDSINKTENISKSYLFNLNELKWKGFKQNAILSDIITKESTGAVSFRSNYNFIYVNENINKSKVYIYFINSSDNNWISDIKLSMTIDQLDEFINLLEALK